jgi:hypothetical protein
VSTTVTSTTSASVSSSASDASVWHSEASAGTSPTATADARPSAYTVSTSCPALAHDATALGVLSSTAISRVCRVRSSAVASSALAISSSAEGTSSSALSTRTTPQRPAASSTLAAAALALSTATLAIANATIPWFCRLLTSPTN